jgi:uncharacterized protein
VNQTLPTQNPATPVAEEESNRSYAPWWHTAILLVFLVLTSFSTAKAVHAGMVGSVGKISRFIETIVMQWLVVLFIWWGLRMRGRKLRDVIGRTWKTAEDAMMDFFFAGAFWMGSLGVLWVLQVLINLGSHASTKQQAQERMRDLAIVAPETVHELLLFFAVAFTAGICEEIIFRGYLQKQFAFLSRNAALGVLLSAAFFGMAHGYQGPQQMILLACYGALFGVLAHYRRSVLPGMITHAWQDSIAGLGLFILHHFPNLMPK